MSVVITDELHPVAIALDLLDEGPHCVVEDLSGRPPPQLLCHFEADCLRREFALAYPMAIHIYEGVLVVHRKRRRGKPESFLDQVLR